MRSSLESPPTAPSNASDVVIRGLPQTAAIAPVVAFPPQPAPDADELDPNVKPAAAARWAGYRDTDSFLATARATGLRIVQLNARVLRIDREELIKWRAKRTA